MEKRLNKMITTAMFAALICVATMAIRIPSPMDGYVNFGDCFILVAAWVLGPVYGFVAGGLGSALADLISGYAYYIPATFIIKGLIAVAAAQIAHFIITKNPKLKMVGYLTGSLVGEIIMVVGYFIYAAIIFGKGFGALLSVPGNVMQGIFGIAAGVVLIRMLSAAKVLKRMNAYMNI